MKTLRISILASAALAASFAMGQAAGPGTQGSTNQQGGGAAQTGAKAQGKGAKQGRQGGLAALMGGGVRLLLNAAVQTELKLTPDQIEKAKAAVGGMQDRRNGLAGFAKGKDKGGGFAQMQEQMHQQQEAQVKGILDDKQFDRYQQIELQIQGASALARKDIADKVGLSADQNSQIQQIQQAQVQSLRDAIQASRNNPNATKGAKGGISQQFQKMHEDTNSKIIAVLNASQKKKWDALLGPAVILK